ncbi:hypothetical protein [Owenweeksia hongkongensis]|uniref:hypothetical protein n=1 Tax=Owenweeksia hongkongensis TaxID=253245 RepID=UPI003A912957
MRSLVEIQKLRDNRFAFLMLLVITIPIGRLEFELLNATTLFNNKIISLSLSALGIALFLWFVLHISISTKFTQTAITYTFRIIFVKTRKIAVSDINSWEIVNHYFYQGLGIHTNFQGVWSYAMMPGKALLVKTRDGRTYKFGLNRPEKVLHFIKTHWEEKELKNLNLKDEVKLGQNHEFPNNL